VFYSLLREYELIRLDRESKNLKLNNLPHIIISNIEHDSVKLIAKYYEENNLAGKKKPK
jgi:hypothetical protein